MKYKVKNQMHFHRQDQKVIIFLRVKCIYTLLNFEEVALRLPCTLSLAKLLLKLLICAK